MDSMTALLPDIKLRFNIEHPTFEECYAYGYESALADVAEEENPYVVGTKESEQWMEGWWAGFYGEEPLYEMTHDTQDSDLEAANDDIYPELMNGFLVKLIEITGIVAVSAVVGFQLIDLVA